MRHLEIGLEKQIEEKVKEEIKYCRKNHIDSPQCLNIKEEITLFVNKEYLEKLERNESERGNKL